MVTEAETESRSPMPPRVSRHDIKAPVRVGHDENHAVAFFDLQWFQAGGARSMGRTLLPKGADQRAIGRRSSRGRGRKQALFLA